MMITESLGIGPIHTNTEGYVKLVQFYENCSNHQNKEIIIAFESLSWIDANMSALLMAIIQKLEKENSNQFFIDQQVIKKQI